MGSRVCAAVLAFALCGAPLAGAVAFADDELPEEEPLSSEAVPSEEPSDSSSSASSEPGGSSSSSPAPDSEPDSAAEQQPASDPVPDSGSEPSPDAEPDTGSTGAAEAAEASLAPEGEDAAASQASASESSDSEEKSASSEAAKPTKPKSETATKVKAEKPTREQRAVDKGAQAEAVFAQMERVKADLAKKQSAYDRAKQVYDEAIARRDAHRGELDEAEKRLGQLREELSDVIVDMYKRGGVAPYLDVLFKATTHEEFLSAWQMLEEVSDCGGDEFAAQIEVVKALSEETAQYDEAVEKAQEAMEKTKFSLDRARLTYLSLAPHVFSLKMEAAELAGDTAALEKAKADYESARAELDKALDEGLAKRARLEGEGIFAHPCPGATYSSGFGYRTFDHSYHLGLDMATAEGTPYYAADDGVVTDATNGGGYNGGAGNWVVIDHGDGVVTKYMHSLATLVSPGDYVVRGQNIGLVGNTGDSYGAHLHFQVEIGGTAVDPQIYL